MDKNTTTKTLIINVLNKFKDSELNLHSDATINMLATEIEKELKYTNSYTVINENDNIECKYSD
jgi:hypothetical protein